MNLATKVLLAVLATLILVGCQVPQTPVQRWIVARETLTIVQDTAIQQNQAGILSDEALLAMDPPVKAARAALESARLFALDGGDNFEAQLAAVSAALNAAREVLAAQPPD